MSHQQAEAALKEAQEKLRQCRHALSAMIKFYFAGYGHHNAELVLVASDGQHISVDRDLVTSFSKYATTASGMKEAAERIIRMDEIDSNVLRSIIVYLTVGPLDCDKVVIPLPKLRPKEAFQLMSVSTRLLMPDVCLKITHDIDEIADLDVEFYLSAQEVFRTSGPEYQSAWSTACSKAIKSISLNIDKCARDPLFSRLSIEELQQVIENISDLPDCWMDQGDVSGGFRLEITEYDDSMSAHVKVTNDNPIALCLGHKNGGLCHIGIRFGESKNSIHTGFQKNGESSFFGDGWGWDPYIEEGYWTDVGNSCKFSFSARMSVLHRKCFALLSFVRATFQGELNDGLRFSASMLVQSLQYFSKIEGEPSQKCFAALLDYAGLSFKYIMAEESFMAADASIMCALIERDSLCIEHEGAVLKFVAQWGMKQQEIDEASRSEAASTALVDDLQQENDTALLDEGSGGIGQSDASAASHAGDVTSSSGPSVGPSAALISKVEKILKLVRFPFIPFANICSSGAGLTSAERAFLKAIPCYSGLVTEAAKLQMSRTSDPGQLAKKPKNTDLTVVTIPRTCYKDKKIRALDKSFFTSAQI